MIEATKMFSRLMTALAVLTLDVASCLPSFALNGDQIGGFGFNVTESLLNPAEPGVTKDQVDRQAARLTYDARMSGAKTLRWFSTDVWPQWQCTNDPENADGTIDPNWQSVADSLLTNAQQNGLRVVVVLANATNSGFGGVAPNSSPATLKTWANHRAAVQGFDKYPASAHDCTNVPPYFSFSEASWFSNPLLSERLTQRFVTMARFLAKYPGLGGIELFNEPDYALTHTSSFWVPVTKMLTSVKNADRALATIPVYSGVAWWNATIIQQARASGAWSLEPFITVHNYTDARQTESKINSDLNGLVDYLTTIAPDKPIIIGEAGSSVSLSQLSDNAKMLRVLLGIYSRRHVGLWVWGDWFPDSDTDMKWDFNHRSVAGPSQAPFFFDQNRTASYSTGRSVPLSGGQPFTLSANVVSDPDAKINGVWAISLNSERFVGFSRAGIFAKPSSLPGIFAEPQPTYFFDQKTTPMRWAQIDRQGTQWQLRVFQCSKSGGAHTPIALLGLIEGTKRANVDQCPYSIEAINAEL
ncbi:hypothetical protein [Rhodoblastus acidophilus]|nr:hypothetical protein [Rhodoblastus acidophilus]